MYAESGAAAANAVGPKRATRNVHVQHLQRELRSRHSFSGLYDMQRATARKVQRALLCVRARVTL